jgi:hypothetical protein
MEKGFCADIPFLKASEQEAALVGAGVKAVEIYIDGRGAQNWDMLLVAFKMRRDKVKQLSIWGTLRVLGDSRKLITSRIKELHDAGIVVIDRESKLRSDKDGVAMLDAAQAKIQGSAKVRNDRKFAQKIAAKGGKGKLDSMRKKRMPEEIARPIWQCEKLTAKERIALLNPPGFFEGKWTEASAYRHLGKK